MKFHHLRNASHQLRYIKCQKDNSLEILIMKYLLKMWPGGAKRNMTSKWGSPSSTTVRRYFITKQTIILNLISTLQLQCCIRATCSSSSSWGEETAGKRETDEEFLICQWKKNVKHSLWWLHFQRASQKRNFLNITGYLFIIYIFFYIELEC